MNLSPRLPMTDAPLILIAEDDPDDSFLYLEAFQEAFQESNQDHKLEFVVDGKELLDFLHHRGRFAAQPPGREPNMILLDLRMPRMNGWEALQRIKKDPALENIPIIILTTSHDPEDERRSIEMGANGFYTKPVNFQQLVYLLKSLSNRWLDA